jgi:hypothetical protein
VHHGLEVAVHALGWIALVALVLCALYRLERWNGGGLAGSVCPPQHRRKPGLVPASASAVTIEDGETAEPLKPMIRSRPSGLSSAERARAAHNPMLALADPRFLFDGAAGSSPRSPH